MGSALNYGSNNNLVASASGRERILFVDDEELFGSMGSRLLERQGYRVTYKNDGSEALKHFSYQPSSYDLVITGQTLAYMTGTELSDKLLRIRPEIPIILCTASADINAEDAKHRGIREFITKPLDSRHFTQTISTILNESAG